VGRRKHVLDGGAHWRHRPNTIEPSMCGREGPFCQIWPLAVTLKSPMIGGFRLNGESFGSWTQWTVWHSFAECCPSVMLARVVVPLYLQTVSTQRV